MSCTIQKGRALPEQQQHLLSCGLNCSCCCAKHKVEGQKSLPGSWRVSLLPPVTHSDPRDRRTTVSSLTHSEKLHISEIPKILEWSSFQVCFDLKFLYFWKMNWSMNSFWSASILQRVSYSIRYLKEKQVVTSCVPRGGGAGQRSLLLVKAALEPAVAAPVRLCGSEVPLRARHIFTLSEFIHVPNRRISRHRVTRDEPSLARGRQSHQLTRLVALRLWRSVQEKTPPLHTGGITSTDCALQQRRDRLSSPPTAPKVLNRKLTFPAASSSQLLKPEAAVPELLSALL